MSAQTLTRIEQPPATLRDIVQERMRQAIIDGVFKPGERLVERPLCDQLGVSRTVVRETIRYLEAEGLVEILPGQGPIVARMSWEDARQIYDIRRMLETSAARACTRNLTDEGREALRHALATLRESFNDETPGALFRASAGFYDEIFARAGHNVAWEIVQRLNGRISRLRRLTLSASTRETPGIVHMQAIADAILSGDADAAEAAVNRHLNEAAALAERMFADMA